MCLLYNVARSVGSVAGAWWNFPCGDWNKSPNSDKGWEEKTGGLLTSGSEQPPT